MTKYIWACLMILAILMMAGCSLYKEEIRPEETLEALINSELIYEETLSPNGAYTEQEEDKVYNTVRVYQDEDDKIVVIATSHSLFFDGLQYEYDCDAKISPSDVEIKWLTLMGSESGSKEDQLVVVDIAISVEGEIRSERKINFGEKAMEIIAEVEGNRSSESK